MTQKWDPFQPVTLCHCCTPDKDGNPIPDPNCPDCNGEGVVNTIATQPSGEVGDAWEREGMIESKHNR